MTIPFPPELAEIIATHRALFGGFIMQADESAEDAPSGPPARPGADDGEAAPFPPNTPVAEMTAEQQAAYWKDKARKHEARVRERGDYDQIKAERDQLRQASMSADEQAIEQARRDAADAARAEVRAEMAGQVVRAELRAALRGRGVSEDRAVSAIGPIDPAFFLTETGEVDTDRVTNYAAGFTTGTPGPDMGQGKRGPLAPPKETGAEKYQRHYGAKTS